MSAFDQLVAALGSQPSDVLRQYRRDLVSIRGNLSSGALAETMDLSLPPGQTTKTTAWADAEVVTASPDQSESSEAADTHDTRTLAAPALPDEAALAPRTAANQPVVDDGVIEGELLDDEPETFGESTNTRDTIRQIYLKAGRSAADFGFVFTPAGTQTIISQLQKTTREHELNLFDDLRGEFYFRDPQKAAIWADASQALQKRLIARNMQQMKRKTDIQYRTHGDRLHYLVIGKVTTQTARERKNYPLFLFTCEASDEKKQLVTIETSGFVNFWLDQEIFDGEISKILSGQLEITIDENFTTTLQTLTQRLNQLTLPDYQHVAVVPDFSLLGIITGFETEYLDRAWGKIL